MADAPPKTNYARDGDVHIAWQEVGQGPFDLLLTPGFISHLDLNWTRPNFGEFIEYLAQFCRVILFDKRGTGLSDHTPDAAQFERRMRDIELVLDAAHSDEAVLFGQSEGGPLACLYAATHPDRVRGLVLVGTFARGSVIDEAVLRRFRDAVDHWGEGATADIFLASSDGPLIHRMTGMYERASASPSMARGLVDSIAACDITQTLPMISSPALVIHRRDDPFARAAWSDELAAVLPNARRLELPGREHIAWLEDTSGLVHEIEEWLTGEPAPVRSRRRFATVLFTDIVESTRQVALLGDEQWAALLAAHDAASERVFERHDAWGVNTTGDGFIACFDTPDQGTLCAFAVHEALRPLGIEIRAGLHSGEVERTGVAGVAGMAVHVAARVSAEAHAGQTLATKAHADLLVGTPIEVTDAGGHELKGVPGIVSIVELAPRRLVIDLTDRAHERDLGMAGNLTVRLAKNAPGLIRGLTRISGGR